MAEQSEQVDLLDGGSELGEQGVVFDVQEEVAEVEVILVIE